MSTVPVRLQRTALFLLVVFGLTWGFDLLVNSTIGQQGLLESGMAPLGMLLPAAVVIVFRLFLLSDDPLHRSSYQDTPRLILFAFLALTALYAVPTALLLFTDVRADLLGGLGSLLITLWTLLLLFIYPQVGSERFTRAGLGLGEAGTTVTFILATAAFFVVQAALDLLCATGPFVGRLDRIAGLAIPPALYYPGLLIYFLIALIGVPLAQLAVTFGEEYAWRGFVQNELMRLGRIPGALLTGFIWGLWHIPIILSGIHTYPASAGGIALGLVFFILFGLILSYAVLKTQSIWSAVFLHGVVNSLYGFVRTYVVRPDNPVIAFGLGIFGLLFLVAIAALILRDPVWKEDHRRGAFPGGAGE